MRISKPFFFFCFFLLLLFSNRNIHAYFFLFPTHLLFFFSHPIFAAFIFRFFWFLPPFFLSERRQIKEWRGKLQKDIPREKVVIRVFLFTCTPTHQEHKTLYYSEIVPIFFFFFFYILSSFRNESPLPKMHTRVHISWKYYALRFH